MVYDLGTGRPVDWTTLLPPALVGTPTLQQGADEVRTVRIGSKALSALVLPAYRRVQTDPECRRFFAEDLQVMDHSVFSAWLDAAAHALVLQRDMAHAVQVCADPVPIPADALRRAGVRGSLLDALTGQ